MPASRVAKRDPTRGRTTSVITTPRYHPPMPPSHGRLAYHPLMRRLTHGLRKRCGVREADRILVAVSGGADSLALLRGLRLLAPKRGWRLRLHVAHIQHHLRDSAEDDALFVQQVAADLGLPFHRRDIHPATLPGNTEANARRLRYAALADLAQHIGPAHVATAHHADDHLETLLMRLLRGTTAQGLRGIAWKRTLKPSRSDTPAPVAAPIHLIRPMLAATHAEALDFLHQLGQPWREDPTNADPTMTRNRLRHEVLPVLRKLRPSVARKALELSDHLNRPPSAPNGRGAPHGKASGL